MIYLRRNMLSFPFELRVPPEARKHGRQLVRRLCQLSIRFRMIPRRSTETITAESMYLRYERNGANGGTNRGY